MTSDDREPFPEPRYELRPPFLHRRPWLENTLAAGLVLCFVLHEYAGLPGLWAFGGVLLITIVMTVGSLPGWPREVHDRSDTNGGPS